MRTNNAGLLLIMLCIAGWHSSRSTAEAPPTTSLEIKTLDLMINDLEASPVSDDKSRVTAIESQQAIYPRLASLFTDDTMDRVDLWKLAARYQLLQARLDSRIIVAAPMFHIERLMPKYEEDPATLELMARLNKYADKTDRWLIEQGYREWTAAFAGDRDKPDVQFKIGEVLRQGKGLLFCNPKEAAAWYTKATASGHQDAAAQLGTMLLSPYSGIEHDEPRGIKLLTSAMEKGSGLGALELGRAYATGTGVPKDQTKSVELYKLALERGLEEPALFALLHQSDGEEAIKYARMAIDRGYGRARFILATWYLHGNKTKPDRALALGMLEAGTKQGDGTCGALIAAMFSVGYGVEQSADEARKWEKEALSAGASRETISDEMERLRKRKDAASSLGKSVINDAEYRQVLSKAAKDAVDRYIRAVESLQKPSGP